MRCLSMVLMGRVCCCTGAGVEIGREDFNSY